jgi:hypothetical protein
MSVTAFSGPLLAYGQLSGNSTTGLTGTIPPGDYNDQRAPSIFDLGMSLADPRFAYAYQPGDGVTATTYGLFNNLGAVDYIPTTASTVAFVTSTYTSTAFAGTTYPLATASSANGTYSTTILAPETGKATATLLAIDSTAASLAFGTAATIQMWNPAAGTGRCLSITTSSSGDGGTFSIAGRDMYGFKMTETIGISQGTTNSSGYTLTTQKAFKYISAIANCSAPTSTGVYIGISNTYGFPLKAPYVGHQQVIRLLASSFSSAAAVALSSANAVLASTAVTQTSTMPDVRGTYASSTVANGTIRLQMVFTPSANVVASITNTDVSALFGATQFSSV